MRRSINKIKKIVSLTTLTAMIMASFCVASWNETHYTREATVIEVEDEVITAIDKCGYVWTFEGDGFKVDDEIEMIMNTMHTDLDVSDDAIEDAYCIDK